MPPPPPPVPSFCWGGAGRIESPTKFSKRGGEGAGGSLTGPQILEGIAGKEGSDFFQGGGCKFQIKNKLKSEIFNDKKKFNLLTFKR